MILEIVPNNVPEKWKKCWIYWWKKWMLQVYMCKICGEEEEDLCHFILRCRGIRERDERMVERMRGVDDVETLGKSHFTSPVPPHPVDHHTHFPHLPPSEKQFAQCFDIIHTPHSFNHPFISLSNSPCMCPLMCCRQGCIFFREIIPPPHSIFVIIFSQINSM